MPTGGRGDCDDALSSIFPDFCNFWDLPLDAFSPGYDCTAAGLKDISWGIGGVGGWLRSVSSSARLIWPGFEILESGALVRSEVEVD